MPVSRGFIFSILAALCWAIQIVINRFLLHAGIQPMTLVFWLAVCEFPVWATIAIRHHKEMRRFTRKDIGIFIAMTATATVGANIIEYYALANTPAVNFALFFRTVILFTIVFAWIFLGEAITKKKLIIAALILCGSYLLVTNGAGIVITKGDAFTLLEAALIAFGGNILGKVATRRVGSWVSAAASNVLGFLAITVITVSTRTSMTLSIPWVFLVPAAAAGMGVTMLRFQAYNHASVSFITMIFSFTPVFVAILAIPFLGEVLTPVQFFGGALIVAAGVAVEKLKI